MVAFTLAQIDGNTVGLGTVSGALVVALGYMLRDRRDTDGRVDKANAGRVADAHGERDRALAQMLAVSADNSRLRDELADERETNVRLQAEIRSLKARQEGH